ncbi:cysteine desulfurase [Thraustotheca clavata]|uniref:Cysteine desulfurase n=1 Tax=Thraustotheca clavata TaxID=74557 RepID=A0A1V9Z7Q7_9STRA|nr:cysteine desulfurase [Thraustotheca clavata]
MASAERTFCDELEEDLNVLDQENNGVDSSKVLLKTMQSSLVGNHVAFDTPFGPRPLIYADFTASGRSLQCIEDYMQSEVLPLYGNTHTTTSITGLQSTCFRHETRQIVAQCVNAKITGRGAEDVVLFTGSGSTSAINKLVQILGLHMPLTDSSAPRPVVFVGPFEHHSNLLPWRESNTEIVQINEDANGHVDVKMLKAKLIEYASHPLKIGSFSAASNLTGQLSYVDAITCLLHVHGALAFWDYAACAPYIAMDMNPVLTGDMRPFAYKDGIFFSGHKFLGGPGSPGVLVLKKRLLGNAVPTNPGGGTVFYVTEDGHRYLSNRAEREEGGTPDTLGSIRLGLAFEVKHRIGTKYIIEREEANVVKVLKALENHSHVVLLGHHSDSVAPRRLPIFSFLIKCGDRFLHYNFVCALLNDLFGVQSRGGCQCAGPYGQRLLGISKQDQLAIEDALIDKIEVLRPGFSRVSFPYIMDDKDVDYTLKAIDFVALHGWKFLPQYRFNHKTGEWKHKTRFTKFPTRKWLSRAPFLSGVTTTPAMPPTASQSFEEIFNQAQQLLAEAHTEASATAASHGGILDASRESLRWFIYPSEVITKLTRKSDLFPLGPSVLGPLQPQQYRELVHLKTPTIEAKESTLPVTIETKKSTSPVAECTTGTCFTCPLPKEKTEKYPLRSTNEPSNPHQGLEQTIAATTKITKQVTETSLFPKPPQKLMRLVGQALLQWGMIQDGDRLVLGVSGGKDSLSLLHILLTLQKRAPIRFTLACATVDPQTPSFDPSPLKEYMKALNVPYHYLSENIVERAVCEMNGDSLCSYCSRMKRGLLYTCCRTNNYNKLVLAQHLDDLAESFIMSAMYNGQVRTMKAKYWNDTKDVEIIRPLVYAREEALKDFAYSARLPVINENCPACFEEPKERQRVKKMLFKEESLNPEMYNSFRRALLPLMDNEIYGPLNAIRARIDIQKKVKSNAQKSTKAIEKAKEKKNESN